MKQKSLLQKPLPITTILGVIFLFVTLVIGIVYTITKSGFDLRSKADSTCTPDDPCWDRKKRGVKSYNIIKTYQQMPTTEEVKACEEHKPDGSCRVDTFCNVVPLSPTADSCQKYVCACEVQPK